MSVVRGLERRGAIGIVLVAFVLTACGGAHETEEPCPDAGGAGAGGAGGAAPEEPCTLLDPGGERLVAYRLGGGLLLELEPDEPTCVDVPREELCIYRGGARTAENLLGPGAVADEVNSSACAPAEDRS